MYLTFIDILHLCIYCIAQVNLFDCFSIDFQTHVVGMPLALHQSNYYK